MDPSITREHLDAVGAASAWLRESFGRRGVSQQPGKSASISLYHDDTAYLMDEVMPAVSAGVQVCGWPLRVSRTERYVNLDLSHVSKGTALDRLLEQTGLKRERLAGIGDAASDLAIRERVAFFACPANAIDELKTKADLVATRAQVDGVLDILDALID
jgi:hydroxymethylpyrimidine pyrophosphatase-like HAD family hydrolase